MIPWIQVYSNLLRHPKTTNLADELKLSSSHTGANAIAAGMLVSLWLWAAQNATDGDLSKCSDRAIAEAAEYKKKPATLVAALVKTGWLDEDRKLHNWEEYATLLNDIEARNRENTKNRVQRYRERKKIKEAVTKQECNVTCNECNAPTLPYLTLPNNNVTKESKEMVDSTGATEEPTHAEGSLFTSFWNAYPENARGEREAAWEAWKKLNPTEERAAQIMEYLGYWKESQRWVSDGGAFIPAAKNFLTPEKSYLRTKPVPAKKQECSWAPGQRELDADDIAAIQRMMGKPIYAEDVMSG